MSSQLTWEGIEIAVSHTQNFLNTGYDHIELRADVLLPVTDTGYRSHFIHPDELALFSGVEDFVLQWLNEHDGPDYRERLNQSKQMELF